MSASLLLSLTEAKQQRRNGFNRKRIRQDHPTDKQRWPEPLEDIKSAIKINFRAFLLAFSSKPVVSSAEPHRRTKAEQRIRQFRHRMV